ncbi:MAG: multiheme c-type cytochrome, partial [Campylobacterota bacterium]|nr:multiheme c-type cytochrome [Campylobacterota bacterium]
MKKVKYLVSIIIVLVMVLSLYLHRETTIVKGDELFYVGSDSCKQCHTKKHKSWKSSSHHKIFKKYTNDSQIIADFENKPDFVKFEKKDIELIIGYQWEQVFAREIDGEYYPFPAKWMELTKKWIPYKTDKWDKTPLTQKCNGCHTTGLNKETGEFKEFGVSCESCHGPGSKHVQNKSMLLKKECNICHSSGSLKEKLENEEDIVRTVKSAVCGQCHSRGVENKIMTHQTEVQFNFPVEYLPGQNLSKNFKQTTLETDKKGKNWWGNGISKNRHQEYADFAKSDHATSLKNLKTKRRESCGSEPTDKCLNCHSGDYRLAKQYNDRVDDSKKMVLPTLKNAKEGITCVVCH